MTWLEPYTVDQDTERLDRIAKALYGTEAAGTVELLLAANPGLAALGFTLPRGTRLRVPVRPEPAPDPAFVRPWE